jgi:D-3-phosphoglycerate dehydrogenase
MSDPVTHPVDALVDDLLEWLGAEGRPYAEVMDAWRTSCPRLPVWEEANLRGWVECTAQRVVRVTPEGAQHLARSRHLPAARPARILARQRQSSSRAGKTRASATG